MTTPQIGDLVLQLLEHEIAGVMVYVVALECARHGNLTTVYSA